MNIVTLKMISGEEIVAELKNTVEDSNGMAVAYTLRRPHILQLTPAAGGKIGLAFVPWTLSNPDIETMQIPASSVLVKFDPSSKIVQQYIQQTSSIQLASAL